MPVLVFGALIALKSRSFCSACGSFITRRKSESSCNLLSVNFSVRKFAGTS